MMSAAKLGMHLRIATPKVRKSHVWSKEGKLCPFLSQPLGYFPGASASGACMYLECQLSEPRLRIPVQLF